jgi:hypothetical protein
VEERGLATDRSGGNQGGTGGAVSVEISGKVRTERENKKNR